MSRQLFQYHPTYGYRFIPGLRARVEHEGGGYLIRVNQAGFRCDHEVTVEKPAGSFRVLLFGDSFTAGDGVSNRDRYGDVLEKILPGVQVLNFGLPGSGTDQQYLIYREVAGEKIEHDLVVIGLLVENIRRVTARYRPFQSQSDGEVKLLPKPYFSRTAEGELELQNVPVPSEPLAMEDLPPEDRKHVDRGGRFPLLRRLVGALGPQVKDRIQALTRFQPLPMYNDPQNEDWLLLRELLMRWTAESPVPVLVVPIPLYFHVEESCDASGYQARLREFERDSGAVVYDPLPDYHRVPVAERRGFRFGGDIHPTPAWHRLLAEALAPVISREMHHQLKTNDR
jgi:hypothetical protein